jgi:lysozyme
MIRYAEGTANHPNPYTVLFGGGDGSVYGTSSHPGNLGWKGVQYTDRAGKSWIATAAGAYQFVKATWNQLCYSYSDVTDFSPASQDAAAIHLIKNAGAYDDVYAGNFSSAVASLGNVWASLPSSTAAQPTRAAQSVLDAYLNAGGAVGSAPPITVATNAGDGSASSDSGISLALGEGDDANYDDGGGA